MPEERLHYNIMQDIQKRLAGVTIGQLLKDSPKYRKQVMDAVKIRRRKKLPSTIADVRLTEVEDWGAPEIDTKIDGCMITRVPVDGGSGVNVMLEQTASDLGYTEFEPTPKILLRMANQQEVDSCWQTFPSTNQDGRFGVQTELCGDTVANSVVLSGIARQALVV